jgi:hypothetical protein
VTVAVAVESSRVVFMAYGIVSDPSRVSDVPVVQMRDVWVYVCCMLASFWCPRRRACEQIRTLLYLLILLSSIARPRWLALNTHSGVAVRGPHERDEL